ncbi:uncharacterized protein HGUI_00284 [Hanseniaspora guilliermondii]|uniref:RAVE complex protein Rav1 C-terminal domain-containing protein n=1 Tax=Hanseniaspora guilliermondii TaxID=56406 RepID=A0A1L0AWX4_9ASCO|nr:uncharacterized protein HGUI_00284 [Hanseniaspora guilliermondii]
MVCQIGQTSQIHQSHYTYHGDDDNTYSIFLTNKNILSILKNGILYQSITLGHIIKQVINLSVSLATGDIILVSNTNDIYIINYVPVIQQWIAAETPLSGSSISSKATAVEHLSKNEILLCDFENISVYKIEHINIDELTLVRTWVMKNPVTPIFNIVKHCANTTSNAEYVCSTFNLLTYNDSLVYIWRRTIIDVAGDIYAYQLRLLNTDKQNLSTVVWNEWSVLENGDLLYTLNDDQVLKVWQSREEILNLSLKELNHDFLFLIKHSSFKNILISLGVQDNNVLYSIYEVTYDHCAKKFSLKTIKQNIKNVSETFLPKCWTNKDYLEFSVDENAQLIYINNFDQKSTAIVEYHMDSYTFNLTFLASGNTTDQVSIPTNSDSSNLFTQTVSNLNEITLWNTVDNGIYSKSHMIKYDERILKIELSANGDWICLFQNKIIIDDIVIPYEHENCFDFDVFKDKLFVVLSNKVDTYDMKTLKKETSVDIPDFQQCFVYKDNLLLINCAKSNTNIYKYNLIDETLLTFEKQFMKKTLQFELDSKFKFNNCKRGIVALKNLDNEILFYDNDEMFMLEIINIKNGFMPNDWILGVDGKIWLVLFNLDHILFYNNSQTKIHKTKSKCKSLHIEDKKLTLFYENYLENIKLGQIFELSDVDEEVLMRTFMDIGNFDKAANLFGIIETNLKSEEKLNLEIIDKQLASEDMVRNRDLWNDKFSLLKLKLKEKDYMMNVLLFLNEWISNFNNNLTLFGCNYLYKATIKDIQFKDAVLAIFEREFAVPDDVDFSTGYKALFSSVESIKGDFEKICKSKFQENKNPHDVGLYYLSMGKLSEYKLLWKYSVKKEAVKINNFLVNYNEKACLNNGYKLLSLHRYLEACWFFLLGNDYKSCFYTILKKMNDFNLAIAVITVIDSSGIKLKECLQIYCIEYFLDLKMFWEYFYSGLIINDYDMSFVDLDKFTLTLTDLECLQKIVKVYGTNYLENIIFKRMEKIVSLTKDRSVAKYYLSQHKRQQKVLFSKKEQEIIKSEPNIFSSFNKTSDFDESFRVTSAEPKSMLDDWM